MTTIKMKADAALALAKCHMTDEKIIAILNGYSETDGATRYQQRWMAAQILGNYGYKLEA